MILTKNEIDFAASLIVRIDSGEKGILLETVNTENQIEAKTFRGVETEGIFYACFIFGGLRIHISFQNDIDNYNEDLASCVRFALKKSGMTSCLIWVRTENMKIIEYLKETFRIPPEGRTHYYSSIEFIMRRDNFDRAAEQSILRIRPYEEEHIDSYLSMLDGSMTFTDPPPNFAGNKERYLKHLAERGQSDSFEAFWKDGELVGLYWRKNSEIEFFAVDVNHQRKGYGSIMLTRAIEMVFQNTDADYAFLYAVDWNIKGQSFYKKYGMEQGGHMYLLRLSNYAEDNING